MNDGAGTVTYVYDSLSRLTSETRYFSELASHNYRYEQTSTPIQTTYQIGYSYNLAGHINQITTPTGDTIDYTRNKAGDVTKVSGTPRNGVTDYVSDISYRAWGAEKNLSVGFLNYSISKNYNSRTQVSQIDDQGKLAANFTYTPDGLINTVQGLRDRRLDRSFTYDHVGRVTGTRSASAAGLGSSEPSQFQQDYGYDEFGHMTLRQGKYWYTYQNTFSANYTNNIASNVMDGTARNWQHDAEGNVKFEDSWEQKQHYYDAVGREIKTITPYGYVSNSISLANNNFYFYDGDGNLASHTHIDLILSGAPRGVSTYYLRSSVLKENLASIELHGLHIPGANHAYRRNTFIYVNGREVAYRKYGSPSCLPVPNLCSYVVWTIKDPQSTMSRSMDGGTQGGGPRDTLYSIDPLGVRILAASQSEIDEYWSPPPPPESPPDPYNPPAGFYEDRPAGMGFPDAYSVPHPGRYALGCSLDGVSGPCEQILNTARKGAAGSITFGNPGFLGPAGTPLLASALTSASSIDGQSTTRLRRVPSTIPGDPNGVTINGEDGAVLAESAPVHGITGSIAVYEGMGTISGELLFSAFGQQPSPAPTPFVPKEIFVVSNIDKLEKETKAGNISYLDANDIAQCARLPLAWQIKQEGFIESRVNRSRRLTPNWVKGPSLSYGMNIKSGTVVATFNPNTGEYARTDAGQGGENHTAIFLNWEEQNGAQGMRVIQQMSIRNGRAEFGFIPFDNNNKYYRNANRFSCVQIPQW